MSKEIQSLAGSTFVYGIASVLQKGLVFFLLPVYTHYFTAAEYGVVSLIGLLTTGLSAFFSLGTGNSMGLLFFKTEEKTEQDSLVWSTVILLVVNAILLTVLVAFFGNMISLMLFEKTGFSFLILMATLSLLFATITEPFYGYLRMSKKVNVFVVLTTIDCLITILMTILMIVVFEKGILGFFLAAFFSKFFTAVITFFVVGTKLTFSINAQFWRSLVSIGLPSVFGLFAFMLIDLADRKLVFHFLGAESVGVYSFGYNLGMIMIIVVNAFNSGWSPFFMSFIRKPVEAASVFGKVLKYYIMLYCFIAILFFAFAKIVVVLIGTQEYMYAYNLIGIIAASYIFKGCYIIFLPGIYFSQKTYLQSGIEWSAAILNIALNFFFIFQYGIIGAAIATLLSYLALPILAYIVSRKLLHVEYEWRKIFLILFVAFIGCFVFYVLYDIIPGYLFVIFTLLIVYIYISICYRGLDTKERIFLVTRIKRFGKKIGFE